MACGAEMILITVTEDVSLCPVSSITLTCARNVTTPNNGLSLTSAMRNAASRRRLLHPQRHGLSTPVPKVS
jgi:hypothetical protein